jgi:type I restriction enzyme S subunit
MENKKRKKPKRRFTGFADDWEERKLGEIMNVTSVKRIHQSDWTDSGIRFLRARDIVSVARNEEPDEYLYISKEKYNEYSSISGKVAIGDLLVTGVGTIGVPYLIKDSEPLYFKDGNIIWFQNGTKIDGEFFLFSFLGKAIQDFIIESAGIGTVGTYTIESGKKTPICLPKMREQKHVGTFFRNLDHLITLHQRKLDKLGSIKKSYLSEMFPQEGEKKPKRRFKGFTDDWEQRKAADIAEYSKGNGYSKSELTEVGTPIILYGRLYTKYQFAIDEIDTFATPKNGAVYSQGNEVLIPASGETAEDIARASAVEKSGVLLGGDLNILRPFDFINPLFLALAISGGDPQKELAKKAQGKSVVHIHKTDIQEISVLYPSRVEQDQIVAVFRNLDHLITLHQRKLEKLKNIKQAYLNEMFV